MFLCMYRDNLKEINALLEDSDNFSLLNLVTSPEISLFISSNFENKIYNLGSVEGGPFVSLNTDMHASGLLQLTWSLPNDSDDVQQYEIEYSTIFTLMAKKTNVTRVYCDGKSLSYFVNAICPGYTYQFRIRSCIDDVYVWGTWSNTVVGQFSNFPCTIGFIAKIVTIRILTTGQYGITAKGAKAADGQRFKGGFSAIISATFLLQQDDLLEILCGGMSECERCHSGGAGGTFVAVNNRQAFENLLLVAGGGGGTRGYDDEDCDGCNASLEPHGTSADKTYCAKSGMDGAPGQDANFVGPPWAMVELVGSRVRPQQRVLLKAIMVVNAGALEVEGVLDCMGEVEEKDFLEEVVDEQVGMVAVMSDQMEKMSPKRLEMMAMVC